IQRLTGAATANWRPFAWMQNDATVGVDLADRVSTNLCRLNECPNSGTMRQGTVSISQNNNRLFTVNLISNASWNARPWVNLKTTVGTNYVNNENDAVNGSGTALPPGAQTVGAAATRDGGNTYPTATKTLGLY